MSEEIFEIEELLVVQLLELSRQWSQYMRKSDDNAILIILKWVEQF